MKGDDLKGRLREFALAIIGFYCGMPRTEEGRIIGRQFLKSGTSAGAHHREAHRARSTAEFISKMEGGLQELDETDYWLDLVKAAGMAKGETLEWLIRENSELIAIFTASVKKAKSRND
ncbi:MAG TPA: four helix bundle protein [Kiritimatiellia bacterium]|jgi:four helix bundle protein